MSLNEMSLIDVVKKQLRLKFLSHHSIWLSLVGVQLFGILLSAVATSSGSSSSGNIYTTSHVYSSSFLLIMTYLWVVGTSVYLALESSNRIDYTYVTTRLSQFISNVIFLIFIAAIGAFTAYFASSLIPLVQRLFVNGIILNTSFTFVEHIMNITGTFGYIFLFASLTYLVVVLFQFNRFIPLGFLVLYGLANVLLAKIGADSLIIPLYNFYEGESSLSLFLLKAIGLSTILLAIAWFVNRSKEVRY